jgi:hypothetical protein
MSTEGERVVEASGPDAALEAAILAYLADHPRAMDTLHGIATWWVLRQLAEVEVPRVARALGSLTARGLLEQIGTGPSCRYRAREREAIAGEAAQTKP